MIERDVRLDIRASNGTMDFSVERWFMPIDGPMESFVCLALVFGDRVVLCRHKRATDILSAISSVVGDLG